MKNEKFKAREIRKLFYYLMNKEKSDENFTPRWKIIPEYMDNFPPPHVIRSCPDTYFYCECVRDWKTCWKIFLWK